MRCAAMRDPMAPSLRTEILLNMTPKLARDSYCLQVRLRGVSGFTIRRRPCRNGCRWPGNRRRRPGSPIGGVSMIPPISADCSKPLSECRRHNIGLRGGWAHPTSNCVPCGFVSPNSRGGNQRRLVVCYAAMRVSGRSRWGRRRK